MNRLVTPNLGAILHAAFSAGEEVEVKLAKIGLSWPKLSALDALEKAGEPLPLGQLADRLACVKSNVTQLVDRLEKDGLVIRRLNPKDRRTKLADLTPAGRRAVQEGNRVKEEAEREVLNRLSRAEAQQLGALLEKMGGGAS